MSTEFCLKLNNCNAVPSTELWDMVNTMLPIIRAVGEALNLPRGQYLSWIAKACPYKNSYELIVDIVMYKRRRNDTDLKVKYLSYELVIRGQEVYQDHYPPEYLTQKSSVEKMVDYIVTEFRRTSNSCRYFTGIIFA